MAWSRSILPSLVLCWTTDGNNRGRGQVKLKIAFRVIVTADGNRGQVRCAFNQGKVAGKRAARSGAVHLQRSKQFTIATNNIRRTEIIQTKKCCATGNRGQAGGFVIGQGKERNYVANLRIESGADFMQDFRERRTA